MGLLDTYRFIAAHPLTRDRKLSAVRRWLRWQLGSRVLPYPAAVPFIDGTRLLVRRGMTGATGNIYCGLHEFEDMSFVLHFLRPGELFVDIGANIGSYTVLAAAAGARVISFEPVPSTFEALQDNILLNGIGDRVDARNQAVGGQSGQASMTADQDTTNQALAADATYPGQTVEVPQVRLDDALGELGPPKIMKIDVEGFESEVMKGGPDTFADPALEAVVMELNGSGSRYGVDEDHLHARMLAWGYVSCGYDGLNRKLTDLGGARSGKGNTLYLRNRESVQIRLTHSRTYRVIDINV